MAATAVPPPFETLLREAAAARQRGDAATERDALDRALALAPDNPQALNGRGLRALADGDPATAARHFARASAADPGEPALLMNLATAHRAAGEAAAERQALDAVLAIDRRHFVALFRLAEWHQRAEEPAPAAERWRQALAVAPPPDSLAPAIAARLDEARAFVAERDRDFAAFLDTRLAGALAAAPPAAARRLAASLDLMLGRRRVFHCEPSGLHYPHLPEEEFFDRAHFPWLPALEAATPAIRAEFEALVASGGEAIRPYVRQGEGTPVNKWTPLDNSLDWGACFLWEYGEPNPPVLDRCPQTAAALARLPQSRIPGRAPTAFFSLLKPRTRIPPHTGVTNSRAIVHLPLIVPEECGFRVGNEVRAWREGEAFAFDDTIEHEAWNDSDALRVVLILDVWNPHLTAEEQALLVEFFAAADASGHNPAAAARQI
jgi:aspartyl/asparaginyl beta-hydroxylase (cupin superfamily)